VRQIGRAITRHNKRRLQRIGTKHNSKELWKAVWQLTGHTRESSPDTDVTADILNRHYANVSIDVNYEQPPPKDTAAEHPGWRHCVTDYEVFKILDSLHPTANGLDNLSVWFMRLAAPVLCGCVVDFINVSLITSAVPRQWKQAHIQPVPNVPSPQQASDYWPISINPVLTRLIERIVAKRYVYPALTSPPSTLQFHDQFAFRPTGSHTAAIISLMNTVINLLAIEPYVIIMSFDFSKAFESVRHFTLLHKFAQLDLPDQVYNWLTDFFHDHPHSTVFKDQPSSFINITASIVQGSVISGPLHTLSQPGTWLLPHLRICYASLRMTPCWLSQPAMKPPVKLNWQIFKHGRIGTICGWIAVSPVRWFSATVGAGVGVYQSRRHCQESHAAVVWRCWVLTLQATSLFLSTSSG